MKLERIDPDSLNAKQKEIYNFQKAAAILADYGFNCIKLTDDWQGADFLAYHNNGNQTLKVQLKARVSIYQKYQDKDLYMCFPVRGTWYLVSHDELVKIAGDTTPWLDSPSWRSGGYSSASPSRKMLNRLARYALTAEP